LTQMRKSPTDRPIGPANAEPDNISSFLFLPKIFQNSYARRPSPQSRRRSTQSPNVRKNLPDTMALFPEVPSNSHFTRDPSKPQHPKTPIHPGTAPHLRPKIALHLHKRENLLEVFIKFHRPTLSPKIPAILSPTPHPFTIHHL